MGRKLLLKDAAKEVGLTPHALRLMARKGDIPVLMIGNRYVFDIELLDETLNNLALENINKSEEVVQYGKLRKVGC